MTILQRGIKIEITDRLSEQALETFAQWIGCYGVVWNCKVAENREVYQQYLLDKQKDPSLLRPKPSQGVAHFNTEERPWLKKVPSQIRRNAGTKFVEALNACFKGLRSAPTFRSYYNKKNCLVTNELFECHLKEETIEFHFKLTQKSKQSFCIMVFPRKERMLDVPKMVWITRKGGRFWLSWSYSQEVPNIRDEKTLVGQLKLAPEDYQEKAVIGVDLGVIKPLCASNGKTYGWTEEEEKALHRKHKRRLRYQRKLSRQRTMGKALHTGKNYQKTKARLADKQAQIAHIRINMAHRVSKILSEEAPEVIVYEKLNIKNMTSRPKAKQDSNTGKWLMNGASRKAGLNKSILNIGWGRIINYTKYKLRERDKLLVQMPAQYSSQECFKCEFISSKNRISQEEFCCQHCGTRDNADHNAACVLKKRFLRALNTGKFVVQIKTVKRIAIRKKTAARMVAAVCGAEVRPTLVVGAG